MNRATHHFFCLTVIAWVHPIDAHTAPDHTRRRINRPLTIPNRSTVPLTLHNIRALRVSARILSCAVALAGVALTEVNAQDARATLPGIAFSIDSGREALPPPAVVKRFGMPPELITQIAGTVVFAGGRGRLDVAAVAQRTPLIRTAGIVLAGPVGKQGDYYLFDSTGFVLVHPGGRTFSSFQIADDRFNYEGRRDGWPAWFPLKRTEVDTLGAGTSAASLRQRGAYPVYWHADIKGRELARGRFTVVDARPGELAVVRWFAATRALAALMLKGDTLGAAKPTVTALGLWAEQVDTVPPTAIIEVRPFTSLRRAGVSVEQLVLPAGYTEAPWPGYERAQQVFPTSADSGAYWKRPPARIAAGVGASKR